MFIYTEEMRLEFRRRHREEVKAMRRTKRRTREERETLPAASEIDKQMDAAVERDDRAAAR